MPLRGGTDFLKRDENYGSSECGGLLDLGYQNCINKAVYSTWNRSLLVGKKKNKRGYTGTSDGTTGWEPGRDGFFQRDF